MTNGVDDFLAAGNEPDTGADDATAAEAAQAEADRVAAEQAAAAKSAEEASATAKAKAFETAMIDERRKRQELEARLAEKEANNEDRDEYAEGIKAEVRAEQENARITDKINISQEFARDKYEDYDEKIGVFMKMAEDNPLLVAEMRRHANPAVFAYKTAINQQKLAEMGDPLEYEKKIRADERAKAEADIRKQFETEAKKRTELPGSLANTRGAAGTQAQTWAGPTELGDILK